MIRLPRRCQPKAQRVPYGPFHSRGGMRALGVQRSHVRADGRPVAAQLVSGRSDRGTRARRHAGAGCRRHGVGGGAHHRRGHDRPRRAVRAEGPSVRPLHLERAFARVLAIARPHGSADRLQNFRSRDSARPRGRREDPGARCGGGRDSHSRPARWIRRHRCGAGCRGCAGGRCGACGRRSSGIVRRHRRRR